jgi:hypothetical protein
MFLGGNLQRLSAERRAYGAYAHVLSGTLLLYKAIDDTLGFCGEQCAENHIF